MDQNYAADVCMEPIFWFVDNFTYAIGPVSNQSTLSTALIIVFYSSL